MIQYRCPKCSAPMASEDLMAGQAETCRQCGNVTTVPQPAGHVPPPTPAAAPAQPQPVYVTAAPKKGVSGLGIAGLVMGIVACMTAWIPLCGCGSIPFAILGLVFGGVGLLISLTGKRSGLGMPVSALIVAGVALGLQIFYFASFASLAEESREQALAQKKKAQEQLTDLRGGLLLFQADAGRFPTTAEGLDALLRRPGASAGWKGPYLTDANTCIDPWGQPWLYKFPGDEDPNRYDLYSTGPNRMIGDMDDIGKPRKFGRPATRPGSTGTGTGPRSSGPRTRPSR